MGNSFRCWVAGYTASEHNGMPTLVTDYKDEGMREAYKKANKFVENNQKSGFCTVGPDSFLKCWEVKNGCKAKFKKISENVLLCYYHGELSLDDETMKVVKNDTFEWTYFYY
jgi:hypothetical protein